MSGTQVKRIVEDEGEPMEDRICCVLDNGIRCENPIGNASFNKKIQKVVDRRDLNLFNDSDEQHDYICDYHKEFIRASKSKPVANVVAEEDKSKNNPELKKMVAKMSVASLKKYRKHYKIPKGNLNKTQLTDIVYQHLNTKVPIDEEDITRTFMIKASQARLEASTSNYRGGSGEGAGDA